MPSGGEFGKKKQESFFCCGEILHEAKKLIDPSKHRILELGYPSPLSANRGLWFENKHFSKTNNYLTVGVKTYRVA